MQSSFKWLLIPPAIAVLLFLGPLRQPVAKEDAPTATTPTTSTTSTTSATPALPGFAQVLSALVGVLLLGGAGIAAMARLQRRGRSVPGGPATLRQTLRLSARQHVWVLQFDDRLLLLGECEGRLAVLAQQSDPAGVDDEREVAERPDLEEGAVPRDLLIPRPPRRPAAAKRKSTPKTPTKPAARGHAPEDPFRRLLEMARGAGRS